MQPMSSTQPGQQLITFSFLIFCIYATQPSVVITTNTDNTSKSVTFYPSSLMISHSAQPLVFFSETKLMHLMTKLKAISLGPPLDISNNCSSTQNHFFSALLNSIHGTQKVINRLLSLSSFSNLLECDSYLRHFFTYTTGMTGTMICPRHYQPSVENCKNWALKACHSISPHEKMFLTTATPTARNRQRHSSFMCHAGLFGLLRKIYTSLGHS